MKKIGFIVLISTIVLAQDFKGLKVLDMTNQLQMGIELAKKEGADLKNPYQFEKAKANREIAYKLSSNMDEAGARVFIMKAFSALSKALSGKVELDKLNFIGEDNKPVNIEYSEYGKAQPYEEKKSLKAEYERNLGINIKSLTLSLKQAREDRALNCAPVELARAEVYYEAMVYELEKAKPEINNLMHMYNRAWEELGKAFNKVNIAREGQLECYTGKPFTPEVAKATESPPAKTTIGSQSWQTAQQEPLTIASRVHFDFNKHHIKKEYIPFLKEVVRTLKENPDIRVRIEGFTDDIGSKAYNDKLALRRAQSVKEYLVKEGISSDRIEVAGFGKEKYIEENRTPMGRFINRRAELIIIQVPGQ